MLTSVKFLLLSTLSQIVSSLSVDVSLTSLSSVLFPYKSISVYNEEKIKEKSVFFWYPFPRIRGNQISLNLLCDMGI